MARNKTTTRSSSLTTVTDNNGEDGNIPAEKITVPSPTNAASKEDGDDGRTPEKGSNEPSEPSESEEHISKKQKSSDHSKNDVPTLNVDNPDTEQDVKYADAEENERTEDKDEIHSCSTSFESDEDSIAPAQVSSSLSNMLYIPRQKLAKKMFPRISQMPYTTDTKSFSGPFSLTSAMAMANYMPTLSTLGPPEDRFFKMYNNIVAVRDKIVGDTELNILKEVRKKKSEKERETMILSAKKKLLEARQLMITAIEESIAPMYSLRKVDCQYFNVLTFQCTFPVMVLLDIWDKRSPKIAAGFAVFGNWIFNASKSNRDLQPLTPENLVALQYMASGFKPEEDESLTVLPHVVHYYVTPNDSWLSKAFAEVALPNKECAKRKAGDVPSVEGDTKVASATIVHNMPPQQVESEQQRSQSKTDYYGPTQGNANPQSRGGWGSRTYTRG